MNILTDLFFTFARVGTFTFGGGYAMLSLLEHECVEKKQWLTGDEMTEVTVIAESTPGPIAINCATYTGLKQAGLKGAAAAIQMFSASAKSHFDAVTLLLMTGLGVWLAVYQRFRQKRLSPILLIVAAATLGMLIY